MSSSCLRGDALIVLIGMKTIAILETTGSLVSSPVSVVEVSRLTKMRPCVWNTLCVAQKVRKMKKERRFFWS